MSAHYLFNRNNVFYFRIRIPKPLRPRLRQREIKVSLRTGDKHLARIRASEISLVVLPFIQHARLDENIRMHDLKDILAHLATRQVTTLTTFTFDDGHKIEVDIPEDREREEAVLERQIERHLRYKTQQCPDLPPSPPEPVGAPAPHHATQRTITQVFGDFERENTDSRTQNWKSATVLDYQDTCQLYLEHLGEDKPVSRISLNEHLDFKNTLRKLPSNRSKKKQYRGLGVRELLDMEIPQKDLMSVSTINNHISRLNALINWLATERKTELPVIKKLTASKELQDRDARAVFTLDDVKLLFSHPNYINNRFRHSYYYWLIPLGLYTGCRLRELCQLETHDIKQCDETHIWYFDINSRLSPELQTSGVVKSLKTKSATRLIPIHSHLIKLGFLDFVGSRRHPDQSTFLFDLPPNKTGDCSIPATKWFQRYRKNLDFDVSCGRKDFHSLRHTLIDTFYEKGITDVVNKDIVGHAHDSVTTKVYRKAAKLSQLKECLESICYREAMQHIVCWHEINK